MTEHKWRSAAGRELGAIAIATLVFAVVCFSMDLSGNVAEWTLSHEADKLDELPLVMVFLAIMLGWFAWRRVVETRAELARRLRAEASLQQSLDQNRRLAQTHLRLQEDERRFLARELHDELGQCVNAIKIEAVGLRSMGGSDTARSAAASIITLADRIQLATRDIVRSLRPPGIDEFGLVAVLETCVDDWRRRMPEVRFELTTPPEDMPNLSEPINMAVYRLVQEALTNVARHSLPRRVIIDLARRRTGSDGTEELVVSINNDGARSTAAQNDEGIGLIGMRERIEPLGGKLRVGFSSNDVFLLEASVPLGALAA